MTAQPAESLPHVEPIDPASDHGRRVAEGLGRLNAVVVQRLRAEGRPIPGQPTDPAP